LFISDCLSALTRWREGFFCSTGRRPRSPSDVATGNRRRSHFESVANGNTFRILTLSAVQKKAGITSAGKGVRITAKEIGEHKHSGIKYVTPDERHQGLDVKILAARKSVYRLAHQQHPERWSKQLRNWDYIAEVYLNPEKEAA
jgi:hypothetical protein